MTRQQRWAKHAYEAVRRIADKNNPELEKKYATHCMKAPALIRQAGLVQAVAFLRTRSDEGKGLVDEIARGFDPKWSGSELQTKAQGADLPTYIRMTREAIQIAGWFRRFAQAELKEDQV